MTKNRILYISLLILSIIYIYLFGGKVPYMMFYLMLILPVFSIAYTYIIYVRFKYCQEIDKNFIIKGDKVKFLFSLHNEDFFLYPYMKIKFCGENTIFANQFQTKSLSLLPFKEKKYSFELECKYRGYYEIGIKSVELEDFLGIVKLIYKNFETKYITVYPKVIYLDRFNLKTNFVSETHSVLNNKFEDMAAISDIRKYALGDSLKKIHWKLTAKNRELMVKNFQSTTETSAIIVLDLHKTLYSDEINIIIEDKILEAAVAVTYFCLSNWIPIKFIYHNDGIVDIPAKTPLDFDGIYKIISKVSFIEKISVADILDVYLKESMNKSNVVIFTSNVDYELYNQIYNAKFSNYEVSLVYVNPAELTGVKNPAAEDIMSSLTETGVDVYNINISYDVKFILERQ
jgi:uncharacterized protein (DUF58 family)